MVRRLGRRYVRRQRCTACKTVGHKCTSRQKCKLFCRRNELIISTYYMAKKNVDHPGRLVLLPLVRHHGLVINKIEYSFSGNGVKICRPGCYHNIHGKQIDEYYPTGITVDDQVQVQDAYEALAEAYSGRSYCFLTHNCVHFVAEMITQIFDDSGQPPPPMPPQALPYYRRALAMAARAIGYVLRGGQDEHENHNCHLY